MTVELGCHIGSVTAFISGHVQKPRDKRCPVAIQPEAKENLGRMCANEEAILADTPNCHQTHPGQTTRESPSWKPASQIIEQDKMLVYARGFRDDLSRSNRFLPTYLSCYCSRCLSHLYLNFTVSRLSECRGEGCWALFYCFYFLERSVLEMEGIVSGDI